MSSRPRLVAAFALGLALASVCASQSAQAGPPGPREQAAWDFEAGKRHMASGKLDKAIEELSSAHAVLKTPQTALAYAQALEKKGDLAKAKEIVAEGLAMPKVKNEAFKVTQARKDLEKLSAKLGAVETKPAETKPAETKPAETKPAETKPAEAKPEEKPAETKPDEKPVGPAPAPTKPAAKKEAGESGGGATVAALVGWSGFAFGASFGLGAFFSSKKTLDDLDPACPNGECPTFFRNKYEDATTLRTISFVGFGVGGAGLITGIVGAAVAGAQRSGGKESAASSSPGIQVAIGPSSVEVSGSF